MTKKPILDRIVDAIAEEVVAWVHEYGKEARKTKSPLPKTRPKARVVDADFVDLPPKTLPDKRADPQAKDEK